jgi:hypothetical protein
MRRTEAARKLCIWTAILDQEVERLRREAAAAADWQDVADDGGLLDEEIELASTTFSCSFGVTLLGATALWAAHTYLVHHPKVHLGISPRLAIQARD